MQIRPFDADPNQTVTLNDGTVVQYSGLAFNSSDYSWSYTDPDTGWSYDETNNVPRATQLTFPGFDPTVDNKRLSYYVAGHTATVNAAGISPLADLNTSVADIFATNVSNQLASATSLNSGSLGQKIALYAVAGIVIMAIVNNAITPRR